MFDVAVRPRELLKWEIAPEFAIEAIPGDASESRVDETRASRVRRRRADRPVKPGSRRERERKGDEIDRQSSSSSFEDARAWRVGCIVVIAS